MIPTTATSSSPPIASVGSIGNQLNNSPTIPGSANASNGAGGAAGIGQGNTSAFLGIASLILEGRALAEDEYAIQTTRNELKTSLGANAGDCGRQSPKPSTSRAAFGENFASAVGTTATSSFSIDLANYLGRKSSNSPDSTNSSSFLRDYYSSSSESASSSVESNHSRWSQKLSQLRQESPSAHHHVLTARQRVAVEGPRGSDAEYVALSINTDHHGSTHEDRRGGDFEILRRMSINQMNFYNSPNSMGSGGVGGGGVGGGVSAGGSGGGSSENFMCSLQSLASHTCLRVGNPLLVNNTSPPRYSNNRQISSSSPRFSTPTPQHQQLDISTGSASSSSSAGSGSGAISANSWYNSSTPHLANSSSNNSSNNKEYLLRKTSTTTQRMAIPSAQTANNNKTTINPSTPNQNLHSNIFSRNSFIIPSVTTNSNSGTVTTSSAMTSSTPATSASRNQTYPQQGPHCDQFLRKMGLAKGDASEAEEHHCDMSYVNITCTRWRAYCIKMENILARGEPICIEVYLGPVGNKILLEQWIITQKEKQPPPTMTLPSLCSAIRSQLYFSQISAWCDLIKKSDKTIYETGRVIYTTPPTTSAAGDLATTTATTTNNAITTAPTATSTTSMLQHHPTTIMLPTPSNIGNIGNVGVVVGGGGGGGAGGGCGGVTVGGVGSGKRRSSAPRLNIFYRIKQYDSTACFNSKPNVHNFPNVNITENCSVSVCLKSLPRITGGIPKVGTLTATQQQQQQQNPTTSGLTTTTTTPPPVNSATPSSCLAVKNKAKAAAAIVKATTSANSVNVAATVTAAATTTITTNANNKSTILIMNCDNNLKERQQQQKQLTASSTSPSASSALCSSNNSSFSDKICKKSLGPQKQQQDHHDVDFEYDDHNIDLQAGGDNSTISCGGGGGVIVGDCDSSNSSFSTNNCGNLSHREKQLLKYRKRMLKRDKKQQLRKTAENICSTNQKQQKERDNVNNKMEQGEDDDDVDGDGEGDDKVDDVDEDDDDDNDDDGNNSDTADRSENKCSINNLAAKGQRQQQQLPNNHINSIPSTNQQQQQQQHHHQQVKMISTGTQTITNTCTSCGFEKSMICLKCNPLKVNSGDEEETMDAESSSASSLSSSDIIHTPRNNAELLLQAIQRTPKSNKKHKHKSKDSNQIIMAAIKQPTATPTATIINSNSSNNIRISNSQNSSSTMNVNGYSSNSRVINGSSSNVSNLVVVGCQLCKRQKTQHHFNQPSAEELFSDNDSSLNLSDKNINSLNAANNEHATAAGDDDDEGGDNETDGGKIPSADCVDNVAILVDAVHGHDDNNDVRKMSVSEKSCSDHEVMEEEYFETSTKLTPHIDRCSLNTKSYYAQIPRPSANGSTDRIEYQQQRTCSTPPLQEQTENSSSSSNDTTTTNSTTTMMMMAQFKTPTPSEQYQNAMKNKMQLDQQPMQPHKHTPKPNLLHIACNFNKNEQIQQQHNDNNTPPTTHNPLLLRRSLPKVNLTPIFCNPNSMMVVSSSPIPIGNGVCNGSANSLKAKSADINITEASPTFSFESPSSPAPPSLTVQKSNSAPTLPNSPSLSPRFIKASAIYKRRSRHLSDRSDRSSLGSDEQFSDEDIDSGMYSPFATSPVKLRTRLAAVFGRKPLLGNLEECLLQRRLVPKIEVMGFKLLLGASGGFCPTQLTIPAAAYFYELKGETLSTPYLCEIRLPRKGYTVPRCGTVQATLLNPMGTVVRMFVIPYDMRDMPTLHQTFIRQRILADSGMQSNNETKANPMDQQFNNKEENTPMCINTNKQEEPEKLQQHMEQPQQQQQRSPQCNNENHLGHFISAENMKSLRYSIHLRFQTSRSGRLMLHTDIRLLISRRTDCDTAAAHAKGVLEAPNELITNTVMPTNPKYSARQDQTSSKI